MAPRPCIDWYPIARDAACVQCGATDNRRIPYFVVGREWRGECICWPCADKYRP